MLKRILRTLAIFCVIAGGIVAYFYYSNFVCSNVDTKEEECYLFIPKGADEEVVLTMLDSTGVIIDMSSLSKMISLKRLSLYIKRNLKIVGPIKSFTRPGIFIKDLIRVYYLG